ncbi:methyltransferase domain-containing protein [Nitrococcus mobilis]|uniref:methyltransferase domain-containing protein n=1 Tax=Nitrococcus mobilis TaxID=35797 RepID=UPI00032222CF|nr:methyltransferase domain-containing protein [Nitrococcus mobilis]
MPNIFQKFVRTNRDLSIQLRERVGFFYEENFYDHLRDALNSVLKSNGRQTILEVGGADRPFLKKNKRYEYHGLDIVDGLSFKDKYDRFYVQPAEQKFPNKYNLVFSVSVIEHIKDNRKCFKTVYDSLLNNGKTIHYFSCKNHPFSLVTRSVGHKFQNILIKYLRPEFADLTGYKTYYDKCSKRDIERLLTELGYKNIEIKCFFGAADYFGFFLPFFALITIFNKFCRLLNLSAFASGVIVYAEKTSQDCYQSGNTPAPVA